MKRIRVVSDVEISRMTEQRLRAYLKGMHAIHDSPHFDGEAQYENYILNKQDTRFQPLKEKVILALNEREGRI